jgi:hypothetical protein
VDEGGVQRLLEQGQAIARRMSWDVVVEEYLLPGLQRVRGQRST